ncbi:DNA repair photolyase [Methanofollis sp. W23]|uniref:SPL family radical SAM protein n=1 Tax=Methanofollis sp. W23 TaxID=2817849 RepID=UPI001AEB5891|nr:radical SAM protein [Methanofollis sp. W23]MBP2144776.1 DNA repair photolyase [Methanofollis sp. W23]
MTTIIYESKGRAREYSELAANLYRGCDHGCVYCYAPRVTRQKKEAYIKPTVREGVINKFLNDAIELENKHEKRYVLLSFTTDPYMHLDERYQLTRKAIQILLNHNLKVSILTKGGLRSQRDFDLLASQPENTMYGATLVFTDEKMRETIEPYAAPTDERIMMLKEAHEMGIFTYVSLEPVWDPKQSLKLIDTTHEYVDLFKVGKLNYHPQQQNIDWKAFRENIIHKMEEYGNDYYIKNDLMKY